MRPRFVSVRRALLQALPGLCVSALPAPAASAELSAPAGLPAETAVAVDLWELNSLQSVGGHAVTVSGNPKVVATEIGPAMSFDGKGDRLLVDGNPFGDATSYTMEVIFKPKSVSTDDKEPRFLHIEVPGQPKRVIMELRFNPKGEWVFDAGMTTDAGTLVLYDGTKLHKGDTWTHVASRYDGTTFKSFLNGVLQEEGKLATHSRIIEAAAVSSVGARMNKVYWLNGLIKAIRVTRAAIDPKDFLPVGNSSAVLAPRPRARIDPLAGQGAARYTLTRRPAPARAFVITVAR